jgi:hypothetical protein
MYPIMVYFHLTENRLDLLMAEVVTLEEIPSLMWHYKSKINYIVYKYLYLKFMETNIVLDINILIIILVELQEKNHQH